MHPIVACAGEVMAALKDVADVEPTFMSTHEKEIALVALGQARAALESLHLRILATACDVAEEHGARDVGVWLAVTTQTTRQVARRDLTLARSLASHASVADALMRGQLHTDQARVIVEAVDALPASLAPELRDRAREVLLTDAARHDAHDLRRIGTRILDVVAPEVGESHEARVLIAEEARAAATASFTMIDDGTGRCHGRFTLPSHAGAMLRRHLLALANPARHDDAGLHTEAGAWKPLPHRLGEALVEYIERYPAEHTPSSGGLNATVVITMTLEQLLGDNAPALLDDGTAMSAGQARRLACEAGIVPAVLGTRSQPLDLGRRTRLFTRHQRQALGLRDHGCTARGCDVSASGCHAHHDIPWSRGGVTDLINGRLLCPRHHRLVHHRDYSTDTHADNTLTFHRRT